MRPVDRSSQGLLAAHPGPHPGQQPEAVTQAVEDLGQRHHAHARRRQLDPKGQTVQAVTDLAHGGGVVNADAEIGPGQPRTVDEEFDRFVRERQRRHPPGRFAGHPDRLTARREDRQLRAGAQERDDEFGARVEQVLAVVEHEEHRTVTEEPRKCVGCGAARLVREAERPDRRYRHHLGIGDRREIDEPHIAVELGCRLGGDLHRQPGLTDAARAGQGHQPVLGQGLDHVVRQGDATHEPRQLHGKAIGNDAAGGAQRRKLDVQVRMTHLRHPFGAGKIAELMGA